MTTSLSTGESAGLYLVRRARTLTAPHQLRLLATAFIGVLVVDLGRVYAEQLQQGEAVPWAAVGCEVLAYAAVAFVLWSPVVGLCVAGAALVGGLAVGGTGMEPLVLLIVGARTTGRDGRRLTRVFAAGVACFLTLSVALAPKHAAFLIGWFGGAAVLGTAAGVAVQSLRRRRDGGGRHLVEQAAEDSRLRADERRLLASELHDVVTHQLSNVSLQVMSHLESEDADELRKVLKKVSRSTDAALTELRLLVRVLRDYPATASAADEVAELSRRLSPTQAAASWARQLTDAGFDPVIEIPAQADRLGMTVQATITRTLNVACDNFLRHAPARSRCTVTLSVNPTQVTVRAASSLPTPAPTGSPTLGWSLRGLRERVDLTGGTFSAGPSLSGGEDLEWVVVATLPHD